MFFSFTFKLSHGNFGVNSWQCIIIINPKFVNVINNYLIYEQIPADEHFSDVVKLELSLANIGLSAFNIIESNSSSLSENQRLFRFESNKEEIKSRFANQTTP